MSKKHKKDRSGIITRSFKTEICFSEVDSLILDGQSKICNWTYNQLLSLSIDDYKLSGNTLKLASGYNARDYMVNEMKPKNPFLKSVSSTPLKNTALRLKKSYEKFFKEVNVGFPKFKSWKRQWFSLEYDNINRQGVEIFDHELTLCLGKSEETGKQMYVTGIMKDKISYDSYKMNTLVLKKERGKFYVSISVDLVKKNGLVEDKKRWIVLDPNHKNLFVSLDYNGETIEFQNPKCFKYFDEQIDFIKSKLDNTRKQKVTKIYDKDGVYVETKIVKESRQHKHYKRVLDDLYHRQREQIKQVMYSIGHFLCKEYDYIGIGDYTPSTETAKYDNMHRSMLNQTFIGKLRRVVKEVCEKSYKTYVKIDERNTTKRCSLCMDMEKHDPSVRIFTCKCCGKTIYRDINSTINFALNLNLILSGTDFVRKLNMDIEKPTHTFNSNHNVDSLYNMIVKERSIKNQS